MVTFSMQHWGRNEQRLVSMGVGMCASWGREVCDVGGSRTLSQFLYIKWVYINLHIVYMGLWGFVSQSRSQEKDINSKIHTHYT